MPYTFGGMSQGRDEVDIMHGYDKFHASVSAPTDIPELPNNKYTWSEKFYINSIKICLRFKDSY